MKFSFAVLLTGMLGLGLVSGLANADNSATENPNLSDGYESVPVIPTDNGHAVQAVLYKQSFRVDESFTYFWTAEQPKVATGTLLVLEVDPDYVVPKQTGVPVLYVGSTPAELTNIGYNSGRLVVMVPGEVDLATTPIFFGSTELPERVDAARGEAEMNAALEMGITPFAEDELPAATTSVITASDLDFLYLEISNLILTYSPDETQLAEQYRMAIGG